MLLNTCKVAHFLEGAAGLGVGHAYVGVEVSTTLQVHYRLVLNVGPYPYAKYIMLIALYTGPRPIRVLVVIQLCFVASA